MSGRRQYYPHRPQFYRYRVAPQCSRGPRWNRYGRWQIIGAAVVVGDWAYCVKWANLNRPRNRRDALLAGRVDEATAALRAAGGQP